jgi:release factor glutamine methyltransferase
MTLRDICARLASAGIEDAAGEARLLFCHFASLSPAALLADPDADCRAPALEDALRRREAREPLAYILGEVGFYGEVYTVGPDVLIPRSDTECLVEEAIRLLPPHSRFADLCTGSGCVAISILCHRPDLTADAFDVSPAALCVARENARRNGVAERVRFLERDILQHFPEERYAAIVSNPPYIAAGVIPALSPEVQREPHIALDGGEDGLVFYRAMLKHRHRGTPLLWEIGYDQEEDVRRLAEEAGLSLRILRDLGGNVRVAHLFDP